MAYPIRFRMEAIRESAFGVVGANYAAMGSAIAEPARMIRLVNTTDQDVYISFDGVTNHIRVVSNSFLLLDVTANLVRNDGFFIADGTVIYQKHAGVAPTSGLVFAEVVYAG